MKLPSLLGVGLSKRSTATRPWPMRRLALLLLTLGLLLAFLSPAWAADGALDPSFSQFLGVSKIPIIRGEADWTTITDPGPPPVYTTTGVSLIFGYFTSMNGNTIKSIAKLTDTTGAVDTSFSFPVLGPDGTGVGDVRGAYLADPTSTTSDIIIWGSFSLTSGVKTYYNLARLTNSGGGYAVDTTFPVIFTQGGLVTSVAVIGTYLTNRVLVGGYNMQPVGGALNTAYHLIRLNADFNYDTTYNNTNNHARSLPGGYVSSIQNNSGQPRLFGTLPQSGGGYHWMELLDSTMITVQFSLGDSATSGTNYGPIDGPIFSMAPINSSNQWIIVGAFKSVFGTTLNRVAQLNSTLTALDTANSFNDHIMSSGPSTGGADHTVQQLFTTGTNQVILAGSLTSFNNTVYGHLLCLNKDGTVYTSFNYSGGIPTAGADDRIFRLYSPPGQPGYLQIVGSFQHYNGTGRHGIATLSIADGSLNTSTYANVNPTSNVPGTVYALETTWNTNGPLIVLGGDFTGVNGKFHQNLAYLNPDGSLDTTNSSTVFEGPVKCIRGINDGDGQILVAGNFGQAQAYGCTGLARLNQDGTFDTSFKPIVSQSNGTVADLRNADTDDNVSGDYNIMGIFANLYDKTYTQHTSPAFARLNSDGTPDTTFNAQINIPNGSNIYVNAGGSFGSGYAMIGYVKYLGGDYGFGCCLNSDGSLNTTVGPTGSDTPVDHVMLFNGEVLCGAGHGGKTGGVVVGGKFTQLVAKSGPGPNRGYIACLTPNFTLDSSFAGTGANSTIYALRAQGDNDQGKLLIGGMFTSYNAVSRNGVARLNLDGSLDNSFNPGTGVNAPVYAFKWFNNRAVLGGAFTSYNGVTMRGIAQIIASLAASPAANFLLLLGN